MRGVIFMRGLLPNHAGQSPNITYKRYCEITKKRPLRGVVTKVTTPEVYEGEGLIEKYIYGRMNIFYQDK